MIRADYIFLDTQDLIMALLAKKQAGGAPWSNWRIIKDYPRSYEFRFFADKKPIIFLEEFKLVDKLDTQGRTFGQHDSGGTTYEDRAYRMVLEANLGIWLHEKHGGPDELKIIKSFLNYLFDPPNGALPGDTFDITFGSTSFTGTTVYEQGIMNIELSGGQDIPTEDAGEFRQEMGLVVEVLCGESVAV